MARYADIVNANGAMVRYSTLFRSTTKFVHSDLKIKETSARETMVKSLMGSVVRCDMNFSVLGGENGTVSWVSVRSTENRQKSLTSIFDFSSLRLILLVV